MVIDHYINTLKRIEKKEAYSKEELMIDDLLMVRKEKLEVYYAPFDYINRNAKVMLLGITPGWTQMHHALVYLIHNIEQEPLEACLRNAKRHASFSGPLRKNLVSMLDAMGLHHYLGIDSCLEIFEDAFHLVHNTSILRYPVFLNKKNYTGSQPKMMKHPILRAMILEHFVSELKALNPNILIIPMGKAISEALIELKEMGYLKNQIILDHFPHPSGANGHRKHQFQAHKEGFIKIITSLNHKNK
jgi:hypothetical protein